MTTITRVDIQDIRFPTSRSLDGSDAMNAAPDYSAAYVILHTDDGSPEGHGLTFTIGRGNGLSLPRCNRWHLWLKDARWPRLPITWAPSGGKSLVTASYAGLAPIKARFTWRPPPSSTPCGICGRKRRQAGVETAGGYDARTAGALSRLPFCDGCINARRSDLPATPPSFWKSSTGS